MPKISSRKERSRLNDLLYERGAKATPRMLSSKGDVDLSVEFFLMKAYSEAEAVDKTPTTLWHIKPPKCKSKVAAKEKLHLNKWQKFLIQIFKSFLWRMVRNMYECNLYLGSNVVQNMPCIKKNISWITSNRVTYVFAPTSHQQEPRVPQTQAMLFQSG